MAMSGIAFEDLLGYLGLLSFSVVYYAPLQDITLQRERLTEGIGKLNPYHGIANLSGAQLWLVYSALLKNPFIAWTCFIGCAIAIYYVCTCLSLMGIAYGKASILSATGGGQEDASTRDLNQINNVTRFLVFITCIWCALYTIAFCTYGLQSDEARGFIGTLCTIHNFLYYLKYLPELYIVIRKNDVSSINPRLLIVELINALIWVAYGIVLKNKYIVIPHTMGTLICVVKIVVYLFYRSILPETASEEKGIELSTQESTKDSFNGDAETFQAGLQIPQEGKIGVGGVGDTASIAVIEQEIDKRDSSGESIWIKNAKMKSMHIDGISRPQEERTSDALHWVDGVVEGLVNIGRSRTNTMLIDPDDEKQSTNVAAELRAELAQAVQVAANSHISMTANSCSSCGKSTVRDAWYCWYCGLNLYHSSADNAYAPVSAASPGLPEESHTAQSPETRSIPNHIDTKDESSINTGLPSISENVAEHASPDEVEVGRINSTWQADKDNLTHRSSTWDINDPQ